MNSNQQIIVDILSSVIRGQNFNGKITKEVNWKAVLDEASEHHVQPLIYPIIKDLYDQQELDEETMKRWRKDTLVHAVIQTRHIRQMIKVLKLFNNSEIPVIVLKGLVLRDLYPRPEFRIMTDADILVYGKDVEAARELLLQMGYFEGDSTPMHLRFEHSSHLAIELHWKLTDDRYVMNIPNIEESVWDNAVSYKIHGVSCLTLSSENQVLYLCLHMLNHIAGSGFGIRQLCDFALFTEAKGSIINWTSFNERVKEYGIEKFVSAIFMVSSKLFGIKIPDVVCCKNLKGNRYLTVLIDDIISGGIYGKRTLARMLGNELVCHFGSDTVGCLPGRQKSFLSILFPPAEKLSDRYSYAKKYIVLIPIAWIHHIICGLCNKKYSMYDKLKFLFSAIPISRRRTKLLRWLNYQ